MSQVTLPHHCQCNQATRCFICAHPSAKVQAALNNLMDAMAGYDDETNSSSTLSFTSQYEGGVFTSVVAREEGVVHGKVL